MAAPSLGELRRRGAQRYRLEQLGENFHFTCEFPSRDAQAVPRVFQADAEDRDDAMRAVLAQVRDWDRGAIR